MVEAAILDFYFYPNFGHKQYFCVNFCADKNRVPELREWWTFNSVIIQYADGRHIWNAKAPWFAK